MGTRVSMLRSFAPVCTFGLLSSLLFGIGHGAAYSLKVNLGGDRVADFVPETEVLDLGEGLPKMRYHGDIAGQGDDLEVFKTQRFSRNEDLVLHFPVPDGLYTVTLLFAETWSGAFQPGVRMFDVYLGSIPNGINKVISGLDMFSAVGGAKPIRHKIPGVASQGGVTVALRPIRQNPQIAGIIFEGHSYQQTLLDDLPTVPHDPTTPLPDLSVVERYGPIVLDPSNVYDPSLNPKIRKSGHAGGGADNSADNALLAAPKAGTEAGSSSPSTLTPPQAETIFGASSAPSSLNGGSMTQVSSGLPALTVATDAGFGNTLSSSRLSSQGASSVFTASQHNRKRPGGTAVEDNASVSSEIQSATGAAQGTIPDASTDFATQLAPLSALGGNVASASRFVAPAAPISGFGPPATAAHSLGAPVEFSVGHSTAIALGSSYGSGASASPPFSAGAAPGSYSETSPPFALPKRGAYARRRLQQTHVMQRFQALNDQIGVAQQQNVQNAPAAHDESARDMYGHLEATSRALRSGFTANGNAPQNQAASGVPGATFQPPGQTMPLQSSGEIRPDTPQGAPQVAESSNVYGHAVNLAQSVPVVTARAYVHTAVEGQRGAADVARAGWPTRRRAGSYVGGNSEKYPQGPGSAANIPDMPLVHAVLPGVSQGPENPVTAYTRVSDPSVGMYPSEAPGDVSRMPTSPGTPTQGPGIPVDMPEAPEAPGLKNYPAGVVGDPGISPGIPSVMPDYPLTPGGQPTDGQESPPSGDMPGGMPGMPMEPGIVPVSDSPAVSAEQTAGVYHPGSALNGICINNSTHCSCGMALPQEGQDEQRCLFIVNESSSPKVCQIARCNAQFICGCAEAAPMLCERKVARTVLTQSYPNQQGQTVTSNSNLVLCERQEIEEQIDILEPVLTGY
jgi:hypothetical protein